MMVVGKRWRRLVHGIGLALLAAAVLPRLAAAIEDTCPQSNLGSALHITVNGSTEGGAAMLNGSCGGSSAPEATFQFTAPATGDYIIDTDDPGTLFNTALYVRNEDCNGNELACNNDIGGIGEQRSRLRLTLTKGQMVVIVVDGSSQAGEFVLHVNRAEVSIDAGFVTTQPGDAVSFAVTLNAGGSTVADVENTIGFDLSAPIAAVGGTPDCQVSGALAKEASSFMFLPEGCNGSQCVAVRAHITSMVNHSIIPDGSVLYTCNVRIPADATPGTHSLVVTSVVLTDPDGDAIPEPVGGNGIVIIRLSRCGNGVTESDEDCDDGGRCVGGSNAGTACTADGECSGDGVCVGGPRVETACSSDGDCPGSRCVRCRTFGGDGCASNCTSERDIPFNLVPGIIGNDQRILAGTSGAQFVSTVFNVPLPLSGDQTLTIGKAGGDGTLPFVVRAAAVHLPEVSALGLTCACIRALALQTCGGTLFQSDGTPAVSCTAGFLNQGECPPEKPCAFVHGEGNAATGVLGCGDSGLRGVDFTLTQDAAACVDPPECTQRAPGQVQSTVSGNGPAGSARLLSSTAIGVVAGPCQPGFCTDEDPIEQRGVPITVPLTTGRARAEVFNTTGIDGLDVGPFQLQGSPVSCDAALQEFPNLAGFSVVGAFPLLDDMIIGDAVISTRFSAQEAQTPTATGTATETPTPEDTPTETATPEPSATAEDTATPTASPEESETPQPTETPTPGEATTTPTETETPQPTETATPGEATATPLESATPQPTETAPQPTDTPTSVATDTPLPTETSIPTASATAIPTDTPEPTFTIEPTETSTPEPTATVTTPPTATATPVPSCSGDCNDDGEVTIEELLLMVNVALETASVDTCHAGDLNADGAITVDEILVAVNRALTAC